MQTRHKINLTGYRILFILQLLAKDNFSKDDIIRLIAQNPYLKGVSQDTIRLDINTLKSAGFLIENSDINGHYVYTLLDNPLKIKLSEDELSVVDEIKKTISELCDWKFIINVYKVFEKIAKFIKDENQADRFMNFGYFLNLDFKLLRELDYHCAMKNELLLRYNSPGSENLISIMCIEMHYDRNTKKLHLYGQLKGYDYLSYLRVDKILEIKNVVKTSSIKKAEIKYSTYKISPEAFKTFIVADNETIFDINQTFTTIRVKIRNEFHLLQRLMMLGDGVIDVDANIKDLMLSKLLKMRKMYQG